MLILEFCLGHLTKYCKQQQRESRVPGAGQPTLSRWQTFILFRLNVKKRLSQNFKLRPVARVCCDAWWATASLIVNFDLDFSICFTFHKSRLSFHLQMEIWKYPTGFCQLSFAWLRFVFTLRITHFSSGTLDRVSGVKPCHVKARICRRKMHMW